MQIVKIAVQNAKQGLFLFFFLFKLQLILIFKRGHFGQYSFIQKLVHEFIQHEDLIFKQCKNSNCLSPDYLIIC